MLMGAHESLIDQLVHQIIPTSSNFSTEYVIIKIYFTVCLTSAVFFGILNCIGNFLSRTSRPSTNKLKPETRLSKAEKKEKCKIYAIELHIDMSLYESVDISIPSFMKALRSTIDDCLAHLDLTEQNIISKFKFYESSQENSASLFNQIKQTNPGDQESIEMIHFSGETRHDIELSKKTLAKFILSELLESAKATAGKCLYVFSTADQSVINYGTHLLKNHPLSPLICYLAPMSFSSLISCPADLVFQWDNPLPTITQTISEDIKDLSSPSANVQEFSNLIMLLRVFGEGDACYLELQSLIKYLVDWQFHTRALCEEETKKQVEAHIQLAASRGVIFLSGSTTPASDTTLVSLKLDDSKVSLLPCKNQVEEDRVTTTGSESERETTLECPTPLLQPTLSCICISSSNLPEEGSLTKQPKHRQAPSCFVATHHPVKKMKRQRLIVGSHVHCVRQKRPQIILSEPLGSRSGPNIRKKSRRALSGNQVKRHSETLPIAQTFGRDSSLQKVLPTEKLDINEFNRLHSNHLHPPKSSNDSEEHSKADEKIITTTTFSLIKQEAMIQDFRQIVPLSSSLLWIYHRAGIFNRCSMLFVRFRDGFMFDSRKKKSDQSLAHKRFAGLFSPALLSCQVHLSYSELGVSEQSPEETEVD